ncbi:MAG TPA: PilN domain-containing protein [Vicinamibacteria bacterium]|nr:PilN domain-containing protein [Vicinamibacteria bacterium]
MIRINLLESERAASSKPKAAAAGSATGGGGSGVGPYVPLLAGVVVAGLGCGYFFMSLTAEINDTNARIVTAKAEVAKLQLEKAKKDELERKRKSFQDQVNLIERLKAEQGGPVRMLDEIQKALPDFVWLTKMDQTGAVLKITGEASNNNAIADFLSNLQRAGDGCDSGSPEGKLRCWFPEANLDGYRESLIGTTPVVQFNFTTTFRNPEVAAKDAAAAAQPKPATPAAKK